MKVQKQIESKLVHENARLKQAMSEALAESEAKTLEIDELHG